MANAEIIRHLAVKIALRCKNDWMALAEHQKRSWRGCGNEKSKARSECFRARCKKWSSRRWKGVMSGRWTDRWNRWSAARLQRLRLRLSDATWKNNQFLTFSKNFFCWLMFPSFFFFLSIINNHFLILGFGGVISNMTSSLGDLLLTAEAVVKVWTSFTFVLKWKLFCYCGYCNTKLTHRDAGTHTHTLCHCWHSELICHLNGQ